MSQGALEGIRILDFTRILAGPLCTMILADLGAEVIKVENPPLGDDTRQWGPPYKGDMSAYFASINRNKKSITLNLKSDVGRKIAIELGKNSDVIVENFKVGQMKSFGLDYEKFRIVNKKLIYSSITGFGQESTLSKYPGYDYIVQAMSGLMSITGEINRQPMKVGVATSDVITGLYLANAIQAAIHHRNTTQEGQYIDLALLDAQIAALVNITSNVLVSGEDAPRYGNQHPNIVPYQTFDGADQAFVLNVGNDRQYNILCHLIQHPQLATDERFNTNPKRVKNREILIPILQNIFSEKPAIEWVQLLRDAGIPAGEINTVKQALEMPHIAERELIHTWQLPNGETLKTIASPIKMSVTPPQMRVPPPQVGQHTDAVLQSILGMSKSEIDEARKVGAI